MIEENKTGKREKQIARGKGTLQKKKKVPKMAFQISNQEKRNDDSYAWYLLLPAGLL
ncbi:hypothetical protein SERLADRAFT_467304 [Serpula lacrymans var. lacrymans S7.9]|uniref:Uncharacterized protein n=1 Tax=Serpula lacrymans var. lacrymans (strain S7.9) TaxID=578457 RepID=F8NVW1_SERL9|nr:uncharacterized protein SERLADRAFT_467304 [Serpula lacrymans var. lacrymans S7.9]EGO24272.1 hypothetical protein SERLADRAFT_467304 [Serpula lacrymans var. lacrymans S7.9]